VAEQRAIACILGTRDDKIELNRRISETLEAMARALFQSWFVDFDPVRAKAEGRDPGLPKAIANLFPERFEDSELGEIPVGWSVKTIEDVAERVAMGPFGSSIKVETFVPEGIPIISGQHLHGFILEDSTFNFITQEHVTRLSNAVVQRGDVVFTHAGNIGQAAFIPKTSRYERYVISQRQFYMRSD
jgi:type I restriction enzyme, S subunit